MELGMKDGIEVLAREYNRSASVIQNEKLKAHDSINVIKSPPKKGRTLHSVSITSHSSTSSSLPTGTRRMTFLPSLITNSSPEARSSIAV